MKNFVIRLLINALALSAASWLIDGIQLSDDFENVLFVALVFGVLNALLKPVLMFLSFPFILLTLGLFAFVVNGVLLLITANLTDYLSVSGLGAAVMGSLVISIVTTILGVALKNEKRSKKK